MTKKSTDGQYYVDKEEFYKEIVEYKKQKKENPETRIPDHCARKITNICYGVMSRYNFSRYTYRDEMVGDAIYYCTRYFDNFDETKYDNPYSYFWFIAYRAGVRRLLLERDQQAIKAKKIQHKVIHDEMFNDPEMSEYANYVGTFFNFDLDAYEQAKNKTKKPKKEKVKKYDHDREPTLESR